MENEIKWLKHSPACVRLDPDCICLRCANDYLEEGGCCADTRGKCQKKKCKNFKPEVMEETK